MKELRDKVFIAERNDDFNNYRRIYNEIIEGGNYWGQTGDWTGKIPDNHDWEKELRGGKGTVYWIVKRKRVLEKSSTLVYNLLRKWIGYDSDLSSVEFISNLK